MGWIGRALAIAAFSASIAGAPTGGWAGPGAVADFGQESASDGARQLARWVLRSDDHRGMPFAIVDKAEARIHVFDANGRLQGSSAALIGQAPGDDIAPGVGERAQVGRVPFDERTTPSGRFVTQPGRNLTGEHVVWVDYESAFAIHRLRPGPGLRDREARMASADPARRRASLGCVVVPVVFYESVIKGVLGRGHAVVYVMPETRTLRAMLAGL
jgi:hypothetical protein